MSSDESASLLLSLPDPCLLAVLQCCAADDQRSLFNAARAHSRLHQAAVLALRSIKVFITQQQQMDGVLGYLRKHGQHVDSINLEGDEPVTDMADESYDFDPDDVVERPVFWYQLPPGLQLDNLLLENLRINLQQHDRFKGVLGAAAGVAALRKLQIKNCDVVNEVSSAELASVILHMPAGLERATLPLLPAGLEHLSISGRHSHHLDVGIMAQLQPLTHLELDGVWLDSWPGVEGHQAEPILQPLQALTRLVDLRLAHVLAAGPDVIITTSMLSSIHNLTRLQVSYSVKLQPDVLACKTKLQHLELTGSKSSMADWDAQLLSSLQGLQQLTHLSLVDSLAATVRSLGLFVDTLPQGAPAAAYSALTASTKLQYLNISDNKVPAAAWQHIFSPTRQLPQLRSLDISRMFHPILVGAYLCGESASVPSSCLVGCCPGLQSIEMEYVEHSPEALVALSGLSGLHTLRMAESGPYTREEVQAVCQLTGLRDLAMFCLNRTRAIVNVQLTQLQQLTALHFDNYGGPPPHQCHLIRQAPGDEPVWCQLLHWVLQHGEPEARKAAAALAE